MDNEYLRCPSCGSLDAEPFSENRPRRCCAACGTCWAPPDLVIHASKISLDRICKTLSARGWRSTWENHSCDGSPVSTWVFLDQENNWQVRLTLAFQVGEYQLSICREAPQFKELYADLCSQGFENPLRK